MVTERQKEIIESALELINEMGIQGLTIKNLSKKIGITEPAIYRHFENKIQILISMLDMLQKNSREIFKSEIDSEEETFKKIEKLFSKHFQMFVQKPAMASIVFSEEIFRNEPLLEKKTSEVIEQNNQVLTDILKNGQKKGEIRTDADASHLALFLLGTLRLFVKRWQLSGYAFNLEQEGNRLLKTLEITLK